VSNHAHGYQPPAPWDTQPLEERRDLEAILSSSFDEIWLTDGRGITLRVSSSCERLYNVPEADLIGRSVVDLEAERLFWPSATRLALQNRRQVTVLQRTRNGHHVLVTATPVTNAKGEIERVVSNSRDITELLALREQLSQAEEQVKRYRTELLNLRLESVAETEDMKVVPGLEQAWAAASRVAGLDSTVLLTGESGVGKDLLARLIHRASARKDGPMVVVNSGAIPENLLESEMFGYERGAFTGARREGRTGQVELADGGTLFLNEVSELPLPLQVKLLHVVQDRQFLRVGGERLVKVDVRIIAATNRDLARLVAEGRFREDLYYRLNVIPIAIPPLRERPKDIALLARHFLHRCCQRFGLELTVAPQALAALCGYRWPGNVRELENMMERLAVMADGVMITADDVRAVLGDTGKPVAADARATGAGIPSPQSPALLRDAVKEAERELVQKTFSRYRNTYRVAEALGISQSSAARKVKKYCSDA
jgi:PAS domain S-box-containing protein